MFQRSLTVMARSALRHAGGGVVQAFRPVAAALPTSRRKLAGAGDWIPGVALGLTGARRFCLYRPPDVTFGERLPLMVMLHGCGQTADSFAHSTQMNRLAARERFMVLYPEQDRLANAKGCWNWFDTDTGRAQREAALILKAIDQVCLMHSADRQRVAITGLSAGASMAALTVTRYPQRFQAVVMHSGIPPGTAHSAMSAIRAMHGGEGTAPLVAEGQTSKGAWPPLLVIHGSSDSVVSVHNAKAAVQIWSDASGAQAGLLRNVQRGNRHPTLVTDFKCGAATVATLVEVNKLGHAWSGGAKKQAFADAQGPDASRMAWMFANKQFNRASSR